MMTMKMNMLMLMMNMMTGCAIRLAYDNLDVDMQTMTIKNKNMQMPNTNTGCAIPCSYDKLEMNMNMMTVQMNMMKTCCDLGVSISSLWNRLPQTRVRPLHVSK